MLEKNAVKIKADVIRDGIVHRKCPNCHEVKPLDDFGLRRMKMGAGRPDLVTNQSWCRACR